MSLSPLITLREAELRDEDREDAEVTRVSFAADGSLATAGAGGSVLVLGRGGGGGGGSVEDDKERLERSRSSNW